MERMLKTILLVGACLSLSACGAVLADLGLADPDNGYANDFEEYRYADREVCEYEGCDEEIDFRAEVRQQRDPRTMRIGRAIANNDVVVGMTQAEVVESWGRPKMREVAGSGNNGHERWTYGAHGAFDGARYLIFENGRVAGWHR